MIIEQNEIEDFLEHHGVKGQKWGIRNTARSVSRKTKKAAAFVSRHRQGIGTVAAGAAFVGLVLADKNLRAPQHTKAISNGKIWLDPSGSGHSFLNSKIGDLGKFNSNVGIGPKPIVLGPIGSTGVSRLGGAIPL